MGKKKEKMLDPVWQAQYRKDRHRPKTAVTVRLAPEEKARWKELAEERNMTLADWVIAACRAFGEGPGRR